MGFIHEPVESHGACTMREGYNGERDDEMKRSASMVSWLQAQAASSVPPTAVEMVTPAGTVFLHVHDFFGHQRAAEEARLAAAEAELEKQNRRTLRRVGQVAARKIAEQFGADPEESVKKLLALRTRMSDVWGAVKRASSALASPDHDGVGELSQGRHRRASFGGLSMRRSSNSPQPPRREAGRRTTLQGLLEAHTATDETNHTRTAEAAKARATCFAKMVAERVEAELRCRRAWRQYGENMFEGAVGVEAEVSKLHATAEAKFRYEQWQREEERDKHLPRAERLARAKAARGDAATAAPERKSVPPINQLIMRESVDSGLRGGWAPHLTNTTTPVARAVAPNGDAAVAAAAASPATPQPSMSGAPSTSTEDAPATPAALLFGDGTAAAASASPSSHAWAGGGGGSSSRAPPPGGSSHRESVRPVPRVRRRASSTERGPGDPEGEESHVSPYGPMASGTPTPREIERRVRRAFKMHDHNDSGEMDAKEVRVCLRSLGVPVDTRAGDAIVARYDADADGAISVDELRAIVSDLSELQEEYDHPNRFSRVGTSVSGLPAPEMSIGTEVAVAQATEEPDLSA